MVKRNKFSKPYFAQERYFIIYFSLSEHEVLHSREAFNIIDMLGDLGGLVDIIIVVFSLFVSPYASTSFMVKLLSKLYKVKTKKMKFVKKKATDR